MIRIMISSLLCMVLLQACETDIQTDRDPHFGDAVRNNVRAMIANPAAPSGTPTVAEGQQTAGAQQRYEQDKVKKPEDVSTKSGSGSNGNSSGGSTD